MSTIISDEETLANIAVNVRRFRGDRSMYWLAKQIGTYAANISRIENAEAMPNAGLLSRIAAALDVTVNDLLETAKKRTRS